MAGSLEELMGRTSVGQTLVVVDAAGREIRGKLRAISADFLTLDSAGVTRKFTSQDLRLVQRPDPVWQGMAIGAAAGAGLAIWDYAIDPSEPGNAAFAACAIGLGALVGAGVDALIGGAKTLFIPRPTPGERVVIGVTVSSGRQGISVRVRLSAAEDLSASAREATVPSTLAHQTRHRGEAHKRPASNRMPCVCIN